MSTSNTPPETDVEAPVEAEGQADVVESPEDGNAPQNQQEAVKRAYSAATTALREAHREEFHKDVAARVKAFGFDWKPKPTAREKAEAEIKRLMVETGLSAADVANLTR